MRSIVTNVCRLVLAVAFVFSGFVKAVDPLGTQYKLEDYMAAWGLAGIMPSWALLTVAVLLAGVEFCLGLWLLFAIRRRLVTRVLLLIMAVMTPLTLWLALTDPVHDCGCFGDALVLTNWQTFAKNVVLLSCAVVVAWSPRRMARFVSESNQWIVVNYSMLFILIVAVRSLYLLPLFDFRPYHVGTDLREALSQRWEVLGSPYLDFAVERCDDGEDITDQLMESSGYTLLLLSDRLEDADDSRPDQMNRLYEYALEHDYPFFCLTASGDEAQQHWCDMTGAEYPFCTTDATVLRTMIRSNPGLMLLHDGRILRKWSHNALPSDNELQEPLEQSPLGQMSENNVEVRIGLILMWFVLPLALLVLADRLWFWTRWVRRKAKSEE